MNGLWHATRRAAVTVTRVLLLFLGISAAHMGIERSNPIGWMAPALLCLGLYVILGDRGVKPMTVDTSRARWRQILAAIDDVCLCAQNLPGGRCPYCDAMTALETFVGALLTRVETAEAEKEALSILWHQDRDSRQRLLRRASEAENQYDELNKRLLEERARG